MKSFSSLRLHAALWLHMACAALLAAAAAGTHAADLSCAVVAKSATAGLANARIHQALYMPAGDVKTAATADKLTHFMVVDKTKFVGMAKGLFEVTAVASADDRSSGVAYVAMLSGMDEGCRALGKTTLAGRSALVFENGSNKKTDELLMRVWIDTATGLPLRMDMDEATPELKSFSATKEGRPKIEVKKTDKRMVNSVVFLFGDAVKAPVMAAKASKQLFGTPGTLDPQILAAFVAMLN
jgi:hypothetical protein